MWLYVTCFQICIHCRGFLDLCIPQIGPEPSKTQQDDADRVMRELLQEEDKAAAPAAVGSQKKSGTTNVRDDSEAGSDGESFATTGTQPATAGLQAADLKGQAGIATRKKKQKGADRAMKNILLQSTPEKIKLQQEDADRAMRELLEEEENEKADAAAVSQKKNKQVSFRKKKTGNEGVSASKTALWATEAEEAGAAERGVEDEAIFMAVSLSDASSEVEVAQTAAMGPVLPRFNVDCLRCPLTMEVMTDPVMTADGQTYERTQIESWFELGNRTSPMTRAELPNTNLTPNIALRNAIRENRSFFKEPAGRGQ